VYLLVSVRKRVQGGSTGSAEGGYQLALKRPTSFPGILLLVWYCSSFSLFIVPSVVTKVT